MFKPLSFTLPSRTRKESFSAPHHNLEVHTAVPIPRASASGAPIFTLAHTQTLVKHPCCLLFSHSFQIIVPEALAPGEQTVAETTAFTPLSRLQAWFAPFCHSSEESRKVTALCLVLSFLLRTGVIASTPLPIRGENSGLHKLPLTALRC